MSLERAAVADYAHDFVMIDHGYDKAAIARRVVYLTGPGCLIVWDTTDSQEHPLTHQWHTEPGLSAQRHDRGFRFSFAHASLHMSWLGRPPVLHRRRAVDKDLRGWIGTRWKTLEPGSLITAEAAQDSRGLALLIAPSRDTPLGIVDSYVTLKGVLTTTLNRGRTAWSLRVEYEVLVQKVTAN